MDDKLTHVLRRLRDKRLPWDYAAMSSNPSITWEVVQANPDEPWDWNNLSSNPSITFDLVEAHPEKPCNWEFLSSNPSITFDNVVANPGKPWDWRGLSMNPRMLVSKADEARIGKTRRLVTRFQRRWRACNADPSHPFCQRRLRREFHEFH